MRPLHYFWGCALDLNDIVTFQTTLVKKFGYVTAMDGRVWTLRSVLPERNPPRTGKHAEAECWPAEQKLLVFLGELRVIDFRFVDDRLESNSSVSSEYWRFGDIIADRIQHF